VLDELLIRQTRAKTSFSASQTGSPTAAVAPLQPREESHNYENLGLQGFTQGVLGTVNSKSNIYHICKSLVSTILLMANSYEDQTVHHYYAGPLKARTPTIVYMMGIPLPQNPTNIIPQSQPAPWHIDDVVYMLALPLQHRTEGASGDSVEHQGPIIQPPPTMDSSFQSTESNRSRNVPVAPVCHGNSNSGGGGSKTQARTKKKEDQNWKVKKEVL